MGGDDVEMQLEQAVQREVEVVKDISLPAVAEDHAQPAIGVNGDGGVASPHSSSSSPATVESQGEKDAGTTPSCEAAEPKEQQQGHEVDDEAEQNAAAEEEREDEEQSPNSEVVTVTIVEKEEEVTIEEKRYSIESSSPADFSFEVSPQPASQDMTVDTTVDDDNDDMLGVTVKDVSPRGVIQHSTTRVSIRTETIIRNNGDEDAEDVEEEEAADGKQQGQGDDEPDQEAAPDAETMREAVSTKEAVVCKHRGLEFLHALREMKNHKSECEVFQQQKVLEDEARLRNHDKDDAPMAQADDESKACGDDEAMEYSVNEAMEYDGDDATEPDHGEAVERDVGEPIEHRGGQANDEALHDTASKRGEDDKEESKSGDHNEEVPSASSKKVPHGDVTQPRNMDDETLVEEGGFCVLAVSTALSSPRNVAKTLKAECMSCGIVLAHNKRTMTRHAKHCSSHVAAADDDEQQKQSDDDEKNGTAAATASPAMIRAPMLRVLKNTSKPKASKRKFISIEDAIGASSPPPKQRHLPKRDDADEHESQRKRTTSPPRTADFQTPRRSKRIKRDPTHSPAAAPISHDTEPALGNAQPTSPLRSPPSSTLVETTPKKSMVRRKAVTSHKEAKHVGSATKSTVAMKLRGEAVNKVPDFLAPLISSSTRPDDLRSSDHRTKRAWLFGSLENADTIKCHYRESAQWIHSPCSRFQKLMYENLFGLKLVKLLDHLPPNAAITLLVDTKNANLHSMGTATVSKSEAQVMYNLGLSLSFPAPEAIRELLVAPLAHDLTTSPLTEPTKHQAMVMCCRSEFTYSWQFLRDDVFIFMLKGSVAWRTKKAPVLFPVRGYKPEPVPLNSQQNGEETHLRVHSKSLVRKHASALLPPVEDYHMGDQDGNDDDEAVSEVLLEPGSVVYMPGGTWFEAEAAEDATWLEVRIASFTPAELVRDAVYQLLVRDEQWRRPLEASQDARTVRRHLDHLLKELRAKVSSLNPSDLLPEVLLGSEEPLGSNVDQPLAAGSNVVLDIRRHAFKGGKFSRVSKTSSFRENPLAVLMAMHEIPSYATSEDNEGSGDGIMRNMNSLPTPTSKKKALRKKPKRKLATSMKRSTAGENAYVALVHCSSEPDFHSKLRVQFQCDPFQAALIEWIREKQGTRFHVSEVLKFAQQQLEKPHNNEDAAKYVLRFLHTVGFLSPVKMPAPEKL